MDWGQTVFRGMYMATGLLVGAATHKAVGVPTLFQVLLSKAAANALPAAPGVMAGAGLPSLALGFHSAHALVLFNALRAERRYRDQMERLEQISAAMDTFETAIRQAIDASGPVPESLPSTGDEILGSPQAVAAYTAAVEDAVAHVRAFAAAQDVILDDIERCIVEWNHFLQQQRRFLREDRPRNIFEHLGHQRVRREREWVWYNNDLHFQRSVQRLVRHRNAWGKLLDLRPRDSLSRLQVYGG